MLAGANNLGMQQQAQLSQQQIYWAIGSSGTTGPRSFEYQERTESGQILYCLISPNQDQGDSPENLGDQIWLRGSTSTFREIPLGTLRHATFYPNAGFLEILSESFLRRIDEFARNAAAAAVMES